MMPFPRARKIIKTNRLFENWSLITQNCGFLNVPATEMGIACLTIHLWEYFHYQLRNQEKYTMLINSAVSYTEKAWITAGLWWVTEYRVYGYQKWFAHTLGFSYIFNCSIHYATIRWRSPLDVATECRPSQLFLPAFWMYSISLGWTTVMPRSHLSR